VGRQGKLTKNISVTTNDPDNTIVRLTVTADIVVMFGFDTQRVHFNRLKRHEMVSKTLNAVGGRLPDVKILSVTVDNLEHADYYQIEIADSGEGETRQLGLVITPTDAIPIGRFGDKLVVKTDLEKVSTYDVYISGDLLGPIEVVPHALVLRSPSENEPLSGSISLKRTETTAFKVVSATCRDDRVHVHVSEPDTDGTIMIDMTLPGDFSDDRFRSELVIKTNLQEQPELMIPVHGYRQKPAPRRSGITTPAPEDQAT
jgi:hypothetical protein